MQQTDPSGEGPRLRKELTIWAAIGISLALMAPSMAANINPQGSALSVGRAVPLAFLLATVGVLLVAYSFVRLCQIFHHAGSVYGFVGAILGPQAGVSAGWSLIGTYGFWIIVTGMASGIFFSSFLGEVGLWHNAPTWAGFLFGSIAIVLAWVMAISPVRRATKVLLAVEGSTVALILIVSVIILVKLITHTAPNHNHFTLSVFSIPHGTSISVVALGAVFGFLSFGGFEAAATLGEESKHPHKDIPRAILGVAIFGGIYFVFVTAVESMGFGTSAKGVQAFINSGTLLGDLSRLFIAHWIGDIITLGTSISAFGCVLACTVGASRILYALSRDGVTPKRLAAVSPRLGTPVAATTAVTIGAFVVVAIFATVWKATPFDAFVWSGTIGTLIILVVYAMATFGAIRLLFFSKHRFVRRWEIVIPLAALVVLGYTIYRNVIPYPTGANAKLPVIFIAWIAVGVVYILLRPAVARRAGTLLASEEGLIANQEATTPVPEGISS
ncbi:MAG: APC family permease [Thermoleophilia bacterium]